MTYQFSMSERSDWFCSKCGKYSDPQYLDYDTGLCWDCQDSIFEDDSDEEQQEASLV